jgi:hypothetical protein
LQQGVAQDQDDGNHEGAQKDSHGGLVLTR